MSTIKARKKARELVLQALYQWQLTGIELAELLVEFLHDNDQAKFDVDYFNQILAGVFKQIDDIDQLIKPILDRDIDALNPVELAVLRLSVYELNYRVDIPYRVVINEALELTKRYGSNEGHKYVNGVLDKLAKTCRAAEFKTSKE